ncbi:MAG: FimV/HubP family polar landmark protein [Arenimonas sp.]
MNNRYLKLSLAMGLALGSSQVMALGLGQLQVKSGLNQPLVAEIPIFAAMPGEVDSLNVRLASPEAFERVGLQRPGYLTANLSFSIGKNARGQNVVLVTSSGKFVEPFLSFLIEADWGRGSITKEYTALIDPPYIAKAILKPLEAPSVAVAPVQYVPPPEPTLPPIVLKPEPEPAPVVAEQPAAAPLVFEPVPEPAPVAPAPVAAPDPVVAAAEPTPTYFPPAPAPAPIPQEPTPTANTGAYGPVSPGKTLWSIAEEVKPDASVTVKQMMVALLRANPEAFDGDNVNKLKRGSVLRIPGRDEATILTDEQAAALVAEQSTNLRAQRQPVPQPSETVADTPVEPTTPEVAEVAPPPVAEKPKPKPVVAKTSRPKARLEIIPPSGKTSSARAAQSGASAAGGTELRAELTQAREDIAVRDSEISDLKSRVTDLESQQTDTQKLIEMKDSQLKALQDEMAKQQAAPAVKPAAAVDVKTDAPVDATAAEPAAAQDPWYMNPMVHYGAGGLLLLGGLVWFLRRSKNKPEEDEPVVSRRISDDADLQASLSSLQDAKSVHNDKTAPGKAVKVDNNTQVQAAQKTKPLPPISLTPAAPVEEPELISLRNAVRSKPQDLEAHLALLRFHYTRGESKEFEATAQTMRTHVSSAQDPRWREAVVMGVALLPGHALFNQAGWNAPKFEAAAKEAPVVTIAAPVITPAPAPAPVDEEPAFLSQQDLDELDNLEAVSIVGTSTPETATPAADQPDDIMLMSESEFVALDNMPDIHRSESELMDIDAASSTKIELARAYLEIGDVEGARSMLEEVAASGSAPAKAMAQRIIGELG